MKTIVFETTPTGRPKRPASDFTRIKMKERRQTPEFKNAVWSRTLEGFKQVHGDRYDYSKVEYVNYKTKIKIICKEHGEFEQKPKDHKKGHGCKECANEWQRGRPKKTKHNTETTIKRFKKIHGDRYDYSKVDYQHSLGKVLIICREHGEFLQRVSDHASGNNCPKCRGMKGRNDREHKKNSPVGHLKKRRETFERNLESARSGATSIPETIHVPKNRRITQVEVIKRFKSAHGGKYDYSKVKVVDSKTKVTIICPEHGEFEQSPRKHYRGRGCRRCGSIQSALTRKENNRLKSVSHKGKP